MKRKWNIWVRYKKSTYQINLRDGLYILGQMLWLLSRRILRGLNRVLFRSRNLIIVSVCAVIFSLVIIPIGLMMEKYKTWYDALWDLRTFFFTSIFIVFVTTNVNEEKRRREGLRKQFEIYSGYSFYAEWYLNRLVQLVGIPSSEKIFLTDRDLKNFQKAVSEIHQASEFAFSGLDNKRYKSLHVYLIAIHKKQLSHLSDVLYFINSANSDSLEMHRDQARRWILSGIDIIEEEILLIENLHDNYTPQDLIRFVQNSLTHNLYIIAELRRPWRWDHQRNMEIRKKLTSNGQHIKGMYDTNQYWM
ncbi:hypothetical protein [Neobacillus rhizophilus]|uniref:Uncharacterized protein n=1 Tax=Neobacillus rhizophilus TaxID=2833579 RepID=A0A942U7E6_9BACI|nr:hypothetical protein [Neobacillus rhizophilus]MBS4212854.1 hypothetical protein [Neobacillus rhizophilus]